MLAGPHDCDLVCTQQYKGQRHPAYSYGAVRREYAFKDQAKETELNDASQGCDDEVLGDSKLEVDANRDIEQKDNSGVSNIDPSDSETLAIVTIAGAITRIRVHRQPVRAGKLLSVLGQ